MKPAYLSASQINLYLACPVKYRLRYIDQVPPAFKSSSLVLGSAVHSAIEWLQNQWLAGERPAEEELLSIFQADLEAQTLEEVHFRPREDAASLRKTGSDLLKLYFLETEAKSPRAAEQPFEVELVHPKTGEILDVPLHGWIDLIENDGTIVEIKTAARMFDDLSLALHPQVSAYSYATTRLYGERLPVRLDCLLKTKTPRLERISVRRSEADDARLFLLAHQVVQAIGVGSFFPNPGWMCKDCDFRFACSVWN
jgi:putative RecB family exonuclease